MLPMRGLDSRGPLRSAQGQDEEFCSHAQARFPLRTLRPGRPDPPSGGCNSKTILIKLAMPPAFPAPALHDE
jgi:hypothetical protein